jgi:ATP-dependent Clp protease ATP-binding subunit ClpA
MYPFERFTDDAKKTLTFAQEEAERSHHPYIGTEHLLLGLLRLTSGPAHVALRELGIDMQTVRVTIDAVLGREERATIQQIIPTARVKKVIEIAFEEARRMGTNDVDSGHLLIALSVEGEGIAAHVLLDLGAGQKQLIAAVERAMGNAPGGRVQRPRRPRRNFPFVPTQMIASTAHGERGSDAEALLRLLQLPHIANLLRAKGLVDVEGLAAKLGEPPHEIVRLRAQLDDILDQLNRAEQDWLRKLTE